MADARRTATVTPDAWSAPHFAAHPIAVKYSDAKGYHVVATRDVRAGDTLLKTRLYAGAPFKNYRKRVCARCLSACDPALTGLRALPLRCARCDQCYYCSPACAAADVSAGHVRVCSAFRDVLSSGKHDPHVDSMVRTVLQIARACAREHRPLSAEEIDDGIANVHQTPNCRAAPAHAHSGPAVVGSATASGDAECDAHTADNGTWKRETTENVSEAAVAEESGDAEKVGGVEMSDVESLARELRDALSLSLSLAEGGAERENAALPPLSFDDLSQLQSHAASWDKEDCAVYRKIVRALVALRLLGMPADEMGFLHLLSRIECNGFGVWGRKEEYMGRGAWASAAPLFCEGRLHVFASCACERASVSVCVSECVCVCVCVLRSRIIPTISASQRSIPRPLSSTTRVVRTRTAHAPRASRT
eukprot:Opistho-1_new@51857